MFEAAAAQAAAAEVESPPGRDPDVTEGVDVPARAPSIGGPSHPSVLLVGELPAEVVATISELAPSVVEVDDMMAIRQVRQTEHDVVIAAVPPALSWSLPTPGRRTFLQGVADHMSVIALVDGSEALLDTFHPHKVWQVHGQLPGHSSVSVRHLRPCTEFQRPMHDDAELNELVENSLLPVVRRRDEYWVLEGRNDPPEWTPLLEDADGRALAAMYRRTPTGGETLLLPDDTTELDRWIRWAFRRWRAANALRFGGLRDWDSDEAWMISREVNAARRLTAHRERRAALEAELDAERNAIDVELAGAHAAAATGWRRLLTASGDDLVDVVAEALRELGFEVEVVDERPERRAEKLQDLDITDPAAKGWVAIVEVKGYTGGAKSNDLTAIERFTTRYVRDHDGTMPDRRWYIVNHRSGAAPADRPTPLESQPDEIAAFGENAGAIIDTRTLFRLVNAYEGATDDEKAALRARLRERTGGWPLDASAGDP